MNESGPPQKKEENSAEKKDNLKEQKKIQAEKIPLLLKETFRLLEHFYDDYRDIEIREDYKEALIGLNKHKQDKLKAKFQKEHQGNQMEMDVDRLKDEIKYLKKGIVKRDPQLLEKLQEVKSADLGRFERGPLWKFNLDDEIEKVKTRVVQYRDQLKMDLEVLLNRIIDSNYGDADKERASKLVQREKEMEALRTELARVELLINK
jgi:hypothetical protein